MATFTIPDGAAIQSQQNGSPSDVYLLTGSSTIVGAGAGTFFGSSDPTSNDTFYLTGISAQPGGYVGDTAVLGAGHATVLAGGIGSTIYGGSGSADIFFDAPATLVTGSGNLNIVGDASMSGVIFGGGVTRVDAFNGGQTVTTGLGAHDTFWNAGPTS